MTELSFNTHIDNILFLKFILSIFLQLPDVLLSCNLYISPSVPIHIFIIDCVCDTIVVEVFIKSSEKFPVLVFQQFFPHVASILSTIILPPSHLSHDLYSFISDIPVFFNNNVVFFKFF